MVNIWFPGSVGSPRMSPVTYFRAIKAWHAIYAAGCRVLARLAGMPL